MPAATTRSRSAPSTTPYFVLVSDTHNVLDDFADSPLGNQTLDSTNKAQPYSVTVAANGINTKADFGYFQDQPRAGIIGNQVWVETDYDGVYEPLNGEVGVAGVTLQLLNSANQVITTTTGADGGYAFTSLPAGVYTVTVTDQFGILTGYQVTALGTPGADYNNQQPSLTR